ncbi:hypothetical protein Pla52n_23440 [Stieleria varia]|uniref:Uncharacterized protein n=1 Tax=Stieleria varia TaxID=2528005 RepID=A0A5C6B1J9_9BACT|nr:hypothetical protein Pla52n_23440 [Stieleria varia]
MGGLRKHVIAGKDSVLSCLEPIGEYRGSGRRDSIELFAILSSLDKTGKFVRPMIGWPVQSTGFVPDERYNGFRFRIDQAKQLRVSIANECRSFARAKDTWMTTKCYP